MTVKWGEIVYVAINEWQPTTTVLFRVDLKLNCDDFYDRCFLLSLNTTDIFSQRKLNRDRRIPTRKTRKAPVKFLSESGVSLSVFFDFFELVSNIGRHLIGKGRSNTSQWSIKPISCNSNILLINKWWRDTFIFRW